MLYFISKKNKITFQSPEVSKGTFVDFKRLSRFPKNLGFDSSPFKNAGFFYQSCIFYTTNLS